MFYAYLETENNPTKEYQNGEKESKIYRYSKGISIEITRLEFLYVVMMIPPTAHTTNGFNEKDEVEEDDHIYLIQKENALLVFEVQL